MNTYSIRRRTLPSALLAAVLVFASLSFSCDDTLGIFASVAAETDNSKDLTKALEESSPGFVVHLDGKYYAGIGKLWSKADGATQWALHTVNGVSSSQPFAGSGTVIDVAGTDTMYVSFADSGTGADLGVWSTTDGSTWTHVVPAFPAGGQNLIGLLSANDILFAVTTNERLLTSDTAAYSVYYLNAGVFASAGISADTTIGVPNSIAYDGTNYWMTAGDSVLTGPVNGLATGTQPGGSKYSGIATYNTNGVIVSSKSGNLYYWPSGGPWTTAGPFNNADGDAFSLSAPTIINEDGVGVDEILLVGTTSFPLDTTLPSYDGYLEFDVSSGFSAGMTPSADHSLISSAVDFDSSLTTRSVSSMPLINLGGGDFKLFACTDSYGLWSNTYTTATNTWGLWKRE
jgi:hypothetical protein